MTPPEFQAALRVCVGRWDEIVDKRAMDFVWAFVGHDLLGHISSDDVFGFYDVANQTIKLERERRL